MVGDGKTVLQQLEAQVSASGNKVHLNPQEMVAGFEINGHKYPTNHDGSQEITRYLEEFFSVYQGNDSNAYIATPGTRLTKVG